MLVKACPSEIKGQDKPADDGVLARQFEAVFISDLHLHPNEPLITARFNQFVDCNVCSRVFCDGLFEILERQAFAYIVIFPFHVRVN